MRGYQNLDLPRPSRTQPDETGPKKPFQQSLLGGEGRIGGLGEKGTAPLAPDEREGLEEKGAGPLVVYESEVDERGGSQIGRAHV